MNTSDFILKHSALQNITPIKSNVNNNPANVVNPLPNTQLPTQSQTPPSAINSHQTKRRLQAERAAIRQRVRNEVMKQQTEIRKQRENNEKTRIWKDQILPHWNELQHTARVKELCAKGIPSNIRGKVWPLLIGNELNIDEVLFDSLMREVHILFHDKMTAKRHAAYAKHTNLPANAPYQNTESYTDSSLGPGSSLDTPHDGVNNQNKHEAVNDQASAIPIPKKSIADIDEGESLLLDVTEEVWFENERQGSLDQEDFDAIQRQIFGQQKNYLYERMMNSPKKMSPKDQHIVSEASSKKEDIDEPMTPFDSGKRSGLPNTPSYDNSEHKFKALTRGFSLDMPFELEIDNEDSNAEKNDKMEAVLEEPEDVSHQDRISSSEKSSSKRRVALSDDNLVSTANPVDETESKKNSEDENDSENESEAEDEADEEEDEYLLTLKGAIPIESPKARPMKKSVAEAAELLYFQQSPTLVRTPPPREKHSADYLIEAGLLQEGTGTTPLKLASILNPKDITPSDGGENYDEVVPIPTFRSVNKERLPSRAFSSDLTSQLAGLDLKIDEEEETKEALAEEEEILDPRLAKAFTAVSLIEWDLPRTFPTLAFFHDGGAMHTGLERVLLCFALYRPDIGYVQGMSFVVATLLLYMDEFEAFKCLANLLSRRLYRDFYGLKKKAIDSYVMCFDHYFKKLLPLLYKHLRSEDVTSEMFLMDWYLSVFTKALPLEVAAQVWDQYLYEGESFMLCVALGILKMYAPTLSLYGVEKISPFLLHLPENIKSEELFNYVSQIHIPVKQYEKVRRKMMEECDVDPEDDVIHFDSSQYRNQEQPDGEGHQRKKSGTFSSTWSKMRHSFMSGSGKVSAPNQTLVYQEPSNPPSTTQNAKNTNSPSMGGLRSSRSSNNISDMVQQQQAEEDRERESYRETRQRGVSVSSKQEASLLLTLQNSPNAKKSKNGHVSPPPTSQIPQHPQTAPRTSRHSHSSGTRSTSASSSLPEPQSAPQRRKSQKQSSDGCLPS